ncbi:DNA-binding transcriptional LysR family regulator [Pseudomonas sp. PvR086]|jgi:DNA-binding transcriptional LysR family regulator|uniref:LysR family transcriptional regulator n=1 Tax=Pseudomonas TaxID=286 RepID=UPI0007DDAD9C|nr:MULTISPECIES: LysR family transcriptional regulator [Pseudomonas]ANI61094.1 LysR family transcriptional regulator [Pseudomonas sp. GR 6-02]MBD9607933.1 LysR family transcriptional regulator [Pseudomonas sp. PDM08]MBD9616342.1 LysR family transcriptional regulator [Pseudomonas sp. PDM07]MDR7109679.1 DNA-binding transcriptional LysR family regulator [Pseudomonas frederiksbergensis]PMY45350.1 LysR family transcriptional regulator [Pseudomonas sp. FW305-53]
MREISLDRLRTLVAIADLGSFAEAARVLHLAPPTVSLHIADLEARVGGKLLSRTRGRVQPSAIGNTLVERARRLLADAEQALEDVERQVQGLAGRVRLGASTGAIAQLMPHALETLSQRHPAIDVQVAVLTSQETLKKLAEGSLEIGLVALPQSPVKGLRIEPWRRDPVMAFLPARWESPEVVTPDWLSTQPLILNDNTTRLSRLTAEWFASGGPQPAPRIQLNYNDAIKSLVAAGYGATLLPHEASTPLPDTRIVMRPLKPLLWRQLGIAHRSRDIERPTQHVLDVLWELSAG